jgi:hypothetical protein
MGEKPRTKAGQIRQAWPDIKALFHAGHSLKDIWLRSQAARYRKVERQTIPPRSGEALASRLD